MRRKIIGSVVLVAALAIFTACWPLIAPQQPRENPNDAENPIAPLLDFQARAIDPSTVEITWTVDPARPADGMIIVRRPNSAPVNRFDGIIFLEADLNAGIYTDTPVDPDVEYWYGAWTRDALDDEGNATHYTGPVTDWADTTFTTIFLDPQIDGWVYEYTGGREFSLDTTLRLSLSAGFQYRSLISFDLSDPPANVISAELILESFVNPGGDTLETSVVITPWDQATVTYAIAETPGFYNTSTTTFTGIVDNTNTIDITGFVNDWISGSADNNGLLLKNQITPITEFSSSGDVDPAKRPKLSIYTSAE